MNFTIGSYKTTEGYDAEVLTDSAPGPCPLVGYIRDPVDPTIVPAKWTSEGTNLLPEYTLVPPRPTTVVDVVWENRHGDAVLLGGQPAVTRVPVDALYMVRRTRNQAPEIIGYRDENDNWVDLRGARP